MPKDNKDRRWGLKFLNKHCLFSQERNPYSLLYIPRALFQNFYGLPSVRF